MKLTEAEMRIVFQIESTNQNAALNEICMTMALRAEPGNERNGGKPSGQAPSSVGS